MCCAPSPDDSGGDGDRSILGSSHDANRTGCPPVAGAAGGHDGDVGKYRPVIDRCYPLEQVIDATRYVETQQKTGNVVLTIDASTG